MLKKLASSIKKDFKEESFLEIISGSAATFLIRLLGLIVGYAFTFLISRYYGSQVLGAHTLSVTVLMMFSVIGRMGMDTHLVKNFAKDHADGRWDKILEVYKKTTMVIIPVGLILSVILYFSSGLIAQYIFNKPFLEPYFKIISFAVLPMVMRFINSECYRGFRRNKEYAYSQNVGYLLYASVILGIFSIFDRNALLPNIAFAASLFLLTFSSSFLILKEIKSHSKISADSLPVADMIRHSLPMMLATSLLLISGWLNTIMLGIWSTETDVGIYSVILKISTLSTFVLMSINSIAAPRFAQLHAKGNKEGLNIYVGQISKVIFFSSIPIFLFIIIFRDWLLDLFGEEFVIGSQALLITMIGQFFNVFAGSVGAILNMTGHQVAFRNILGISTIINIIACVIFIPLYGLMGSAIAGMIFMGCWNLISMVYIKMKFNIKTYFWPF
ncbi:MAG TPA: flippase [Bacteroidia bacterium]|nr:flippase [Bacteroidia bacterium]